MKSLFGFHETLEVVNNDIHELADNTTDAQRVIHKDAKKKNGKDAYYIQSVVDATNFDRISHAESGNETCDILVQY